MKHPAPTLLLVALVGCTLPTIAQAASIKDDQFTLNVGMDVQTREEMTSAKNTTGGDFDPVNGRDGKSDVVDWQSRRARLLINGSFQEVWKFYLGYLSDKADNTDYNNANRGVFLFKAYLERVFKDGDITHALHAGLDYPFYNLAIQADPRWLFPNQRATGTLGNIRGEGARYMVSGDMFTFGADIMENLQSPRNAANANSSGGLFYSSRIEISALGGPKPVYNESYAGKEGHSLILAADIGYDNKDLQTANVQANALGWGLEATYHNNGLSALAEFRTLKTNNSSINNVALGAVPDHVNSRIWLAQAGYAIPVGDFFIEPALRYTKIDYNTEVNEFVNYNGGVTTAGIIPIASGINGDAESGKSGKIIDVGLNFYFAGHTIQCQLAYSHWSAENGDAKANFIRFQQQIAF